MLGIDDVTDCETEDDGEDDEDAQVFDVYRSPGTCHRAGGIDPALLKREVKAPEPFHVKIEEQPLSFEWFQKVYKRAAARGAFK